MGIFDRVSCLECLVALLMVSHSTAEESDTAHTHHHDMEPLDSPPVKLSDVRLQDYRPGYVHKDVNPQKGDADRRPDPHLRPEHRVKKKSKYPDLVPAAGSPHAYGIPGYSEPYDHFPSSYEPVASNYGSVSDVHVTGHELEDGHEKKYSPRDLAMSFLAYLAVLSILQGGLIALTTSNTVIGIFANRNKRDVSQPAELTRVPLVTLPPQVSESTRLFREDTEIQCIQHRVCEINRQLSKQFGKAGMLLGQYVSEWVTKFVDPGWVRLVADAGQAGLRDTECAVLYRSCHPSTTSE